jgi:hypothetical protein
MKTPAPLLITASLDSGKTPYVNLSSTSARIEAHMEGLLAWCREPWVGSIVLVKNCSAKIRPEVLEHVAASYGKELEFIQVTPSPRTVLQGKGFGEGDMILQALEKSETLRRADDFIKVTGKLFCPGADAIFNGQSGGEFFVCRTFDAKGVSLIRKRLSPLYQTERGSVAMAFLKRRVRVPWSWVAAAPSALVDTRLYRVKRDFYSQILKNSYRRVQDALGYTLERAFMDDLRGCDRPVKMLEISPGIIGVSGSVGTRAGEFAEEIRAEARDLAVRLVD